MRVRRMVVLMLVLLGTGVHARTGHHAYRDFWYPTYHGERLDYCAQDDKTCGADIANEYCHVMGYTRASEQRVDHNVGRTNYVASKGQCKGWRCDGFMVISCEEKLPEKSPHPYAYRSKTFAFPRIDNYRVDWCYAESHECGKRSAYSFCRRMGYSKATAYKQETNVPATKALGDNALCFGKTCSGFEGITCYR